MTILVIGDANADLSAAVGRFPFEGDDAPLGALEWGSGGTGVNVTVALGRIGAAARLLARVGADPAADVALRMARDAGADLSTVQVDPATATGLCFSVVSPGGERTFFSFRGANQALEPPANLDALLEGVRWVEVGGHALLEGRQRTTTEGLIGAAAERGVPVSLDLCLPLMRARRDQVLALLPTLEVLFANELELALLLGEGTKEPAELHDALRRLEGPRTTVAKLGPRGSVVASGGHVCVVPAYAVEAVDTNGCGDAFIAGFIHARLAGMGIETCARVGNALGALTATGPGAADAVPDRARLRAFLEGGGLSAELRSML